MPQAYGQFDGNGTYISGTDNFSVSKLGAGQYRVTLNSGSSFPPVAVVNPFSGYVTANAVVSAANGDENSPSFVIYTGFSDQQGYHDLDGVIFTAWWQAQ